MSDPRCTCEVIDPGQLSGPDPEPATWEQDPDCPVHPAEVETVDLVAALREAVEAAKARREAGGQS